MKLMFISPYLVMNGIGAAVGSYSHLNALTSIVDKEIIVVAIDFEQKKTYSLPESYVVIDSYRNQWEKYSNILSLNGISINNRVCKEIITIIKNESVDVVFIDESTMGSLCKKIRKFCPNVKEIITFYHDVKANLCRQWIKKGGIKSIPYNLGLMYNEWLNDRYSDKKVVLNHRDWKLYEKYYKHEPNFALPHYVSTRPLDVSIDSCYKSSLFKMIFVGADYYPNVQGISWFIDKVMPEIQGDIELQIVGKGMEKYKSNWEDSNIHVIGTVDELGEWYLNANVVISPIFVGGGMKTKTAEAFQYGKRFIGTTESYEGYCDSIPNNFWNKYCWRADDVQSFIKAIEQVKMMESTVCIEEVYDVFRHNFSLEAGISNMRNILGLHRDEGLS